MSEGMARPGSQRWLLWLSVAVLVSLTGYAIVVPLAVPHDSRLVDYAVAGQPPSALHWLGTDSVGRDLFVRVAGGLRLSLGIALLAAVVATVIGTTVGLVAGFLGGVVDQVLMRTSDAINALPHLILGLVIVGMFRGNVAAMVVALVVTHWITTARIVRAQTLSLRTGDLIAWAWTSGMGRGKIIWNHLLPAALGQAVISVLLLAPHTVWHESTLSFLGLGLPPHEPSLGSLLTDAEGGLLLGQWWLLAFPGGALVLVVFSLGVVARRLTHVVIGGEV